MIGMLAVNTVEYQRCFVLLSVWITLPKDMKFSDDIKKKMLYFILFKYIVRRSLQLCKVDTCPNDKLKSELSTDLDKFQMSIAILQYFDQHITITKINLVYKSFEYLKVSIHPIAETIRISNSSSELNSEFHCETSSFIMGEYNFAKKVAKVAKVFAIVAAKVTLGLTTDILAIPAVILYYRGVYNGAEKVIFLGRTYETSITLFGSYQGNWNVFKGHYSDDVTWGGYWGY
jgi:hypothetical protein